MRDPSFYVQRKTTGVFGQRRLKSQNRTSTTGEQRSVMRTSKMSEPLSDIHEIKKGKVFSPDTSSRGTEVFTGWD